MHDDEYSQASKNNELHLHIKTLLKINKNQNKLTNQLEPHRYKKLRVVVIREKGLSVQNL